MMVKDVDVIWDIDRITGFEPDRDMGDLSGLKKSIKQFGLLHPITVDTSGRLIAGRRRLQALKELGETRVPVKIVDRSKESDRIAISIHENTHRKPLTDIENALLIEKFEEAKRRELGSAQRGGDRRSASVKNQTLDSKVWSSKKTAETFDTSESTISQIKKIAATVKSDTGEVDEDLARLSAEAILEITKAPKPDELKKEIKEDIRAGKRLVARDIKKKIREQLAKEILKSVDPLPDGKYDVIVADPPWRYDFSETTSREIENKYPTMETEDIMALDIPSADNAVLYLWATSPKLPDALRVMEAWGFEYKSNMVWDKEVIGMGYWSRGQHELILIGTKGNFSPPKAEDRVSSIIKEKRGKHSAKPEKLYTLIETMFPNRKYLELFARQKRNGWAVWGAESDGGQN